VSKIARGMPADMCMPQLQEGDEIVHINGRIVKELPHQEVLCLLWFIPSLLSPGSKSKFSLLLTIYFFNGSSEETFHSLSVFQHTRRKKRTRMRSTTGWGRENEQREPIEEYIFYFSRSPLLIPRHFADISQHCSECCLWVTTWD